MLSLFPQILFLAPFSALLIRLSLSIAFGFAAWKHIGGSLTNNLVAIIEVVLAVTLLIGAGTQLAALIAALMTLAVLFYAPARVYPRSTLLLALVMCLSLVVTGAGAFAFDLPL